LEIAQILTEEEAVYDVDFFGCIFWVKRARVINPLPVTKPPADVRRPVTVRVDHTV
jgi:hypothetical protein